MNQHVIGVVLAASLLFSGLTVAAPDGYGPIPIPSVSVGDTWTFRYTDIWKGQPGNLTRQEVVAVEATGISIDTKRATDGRLLSHLRFSREMNPVDRGNMHFAPAFTRYAFPLEPGKEWSSDVLGENLKSGKNWRYQFKGKVLGWEKIKVPAGEFDVLKIDVAAYYVGRESATNGGSGNLRETLWFAPAVNNFVRLEYQDTDWQGKIFNRDAWELAAFTRKASVAATAPPVAEGSSDSPGR